MISKWTLTTLELFHHCSLQRHIKFSEDDIKAACKELRNSAAAGPDGVPALLLKTCSDELSSPLFHIWRAYLDSGEIPLEQLLVLICPLHKGGSRSVPKNYRPVALTSHIIKVFERVLRRALVSHIDTLGLLPAGHIGTQSWRVWSLEMELTMSI